MSTGGNPPPTIGRLSPPRPGAAPLGRFDAALKHYRQRFASIVERVGGGVQSVVSRFATWLDVDGEGEDGEG